MVETAIPELQRIYREEVASALREKRGYRNPHQIPRVTKVVVNCSVGSAQDVKVALDDATHEWAGRRMNRAIQSAIGGKSVEDVGATVAHARGVDAHLAEHGALPVKES